MSSARKQPRILSWRRAMVLMGLSTAAAVFSLVQESLLLTRVVVDRNPARFVVATTDGVTNIGESRTDARRVDLTTADGASSDNAAAIRLDGTRQTVPPTRQAATPSTSESDPSTRNSFRIPEIALLASFPNSGTSYTMTLVEKGSNLSTATNYGQEVTARGQEAYSIQGKFSSEGPYWDGVSALALERTVRKLPDTFVLTKTHCGGRCILCQPSDFVVNTTTFLRTCLRTTTAEKGDAGRITERIMAPNRIARVVHLIRNPLHNIVARYHLHRRHFLRRHPEWEDTEFANNATGFQRWCRELDQMLLEVEPGAFDALTNRTHIDPNLICKAELYKYAQWHERVLDMIPLLEEARRESVPVLTIHYEDYQYQFPETVERIFNFVQQNVSARKLRPFRSLPTYELDHYTTGQREAARQFLQAIASPRVLKLLARYL